MCRNLLPESRFGVSHVNMKVRRQYTMRARADAAAATRERIVHSAVQLLHERLTSDIRLDDVARRAEVSVQTLLRVFRSRSELFAVAFDEALHVIAAELDWVEPGDVAASVSAWLDHYERIGDVVIRSLAEESDPAVEPIVRTGRTKHRERVERQFGPQLVERSPHERVELVDALMCTCDVYTWKLLRRDVGRSRPEAEAIVRRMVTALLGGDRDVAV